MLVKSPLLVGSMNGILANFHNVYHIFGRACLLRTILRVIYTSIDELVITEVFSCLEMISTKKTGVGGAFAATGMSLASLLMPGCSQSFDAEAFSQEYRSGLGPRPIATRPDTRPAGISKDWDNAHVFAVQGAVIKILGDEYHGFARTVAEGIDAKTIQVSRESKWPSLMPGIAKAMRENRPLVGIVHSIGLNRLLEGVAPSVGREGRQIDILIVLDGSLLQDGYVLAPPDEYRKFPSTIGHVINLHASDGLFNGRQISEADFEDPQYGKGRFVNIPVSQGHIGMATPYNAAQVIEEAKKAIARLRAEELAKAAVQGVASRPASSQPVGTQPAR